MKVAIIFPSHRVMEAVMQCDTFYGPNMNVIYRGSRAHHADGGSVEGFAVGDEVDLRFVMGRRADVVIFHDSWLTHSRNWSAEHRHTIMASIRAHLLK